MAHMFDGSDAAASAASIVETTAEPRAVEDGARVDRSLAPIMPLLLALLGELNAPSDAVECAWLRSDDQYAIRLPASRLSGEAILLPRRALEQALVDRTARTRVRNLLRAWVEAPRPRRASEAALQTAYFSALDVRSLPGPRCARCEGPLLAADPTVLHEGSRSHLACPPAW
jgi:hypothetical protein